MRVTVDSGAAESVIPSDAVPEYESVPHAEDMFYQTASGEIMANEGEQKIPMVSGNGGAIQAMTFQKCDVTKPLASVKRILEKNHAVVFSPAEYGGSYIFNLETWETQELVEEDGNYYMEVWIPPPEVMKGYEGFGGLP